jgi:hypothetical protein
MSFVSYSLKLVAFALVLSLALTGRAQAQFSCNSTQDDMLAWFTMGFPDRVDQHMGPGNANPSYTYMNPDNGNGPYANTGYFLWIKGASGYPWDVKAWDTNYIYDRSTELVWTDPTSFKRFNQDLPISPRCIAKKKAGPVLLIRASGSIYQKYQNCQSVSTNPLSNVTTQISAPFNAKLGNVGRVSARAFTYMYSCDVNYANCKYKEIFSLARGYGQYDWKYYILQNGSYVFQKESIIDQKVPGQTTPSLPCANSYQ